MAWNKEVSMDWGNYSRRRVFSNRMLGRKKIKTFYNSTPFTPPLKPFRFLETVEGILEGRLFKPERGSLSLLVEPLPHKWPEVEKVMETFFNIHMKNGSFEGWRENIHILATPYSKRFLVRFFYILSVGQNGVWEEQWKAFTALQGKTRAWMVWWAQVLHERLEKP